MCNFILIFQAGVIKNGNKLRENHDEKFAKITVSPLQEITVPRDEAAEFLDNLKVMPVETLKNTTEAIIRPFVHFYNVLSTPDMEKSKLLFK